MTDTKIIKALECSVEHNERKNASCDGCPLEKVFPYCNRECSEDTLDVMCLDLINRQKAEIEQKRKFLGDSIEEIKGLKLKVQIQEQEIKKLQNNGIRADWQEYCRKLRNEAIKEFAERFKALLEKELSWCECVDEITKPLDNLVNEMCGDNK